MIVNQKKCILLNVMQTSEDTWILNEVNKMKFFLFCPFLFSLILHSFVIRMKEYERERRLLERGKRKRLVAEREALED